MSYIKSRKRVSKVAIASLIGVASSYAIGQEDTKQQLETIVVNAEADNSYYKKEVQSPKITTPLIDTPRTINVISKKEIDERAATSLQDVLRTTPGITLGSGEGGTPMGDRPFIRGYEASTDIYVDGVRDYARGSRDMFNLEAVEVSKGAGSVYGGRGSTGGTINLVTKKPYDKTSGEFTSEYQNSGEGQNQYRFTTDANLAVTNHIAVRLNAMLNQGEVAGRDQVEVDRWGIAPSITFGLNTPTRVNLSYSHLQYDDQPDMGLPFANDAYPSRVTPIETLPREINLGRPQIDFSKYTSQNASITVEHDFNEKFKARFTANDLKTEQDYFFTRLSFGNCSATSTGSCATEDSGLQFRRDNRTRWRASHSNAAQLDFNALFDTGSIKHNLVFGTDYSKQRISNKTMTVTGAGREMVSLYNPTWQDYSNFSISYGAETKAGEIKNLGAYVFDTITVLPQVDVNLGVRYDDFEATDFTLKNTDKMWNWQTGIVYKPLENARIYANYATSSNPSGENLGQAGGADGAASANLTSNNVNLNPEKSRSIELGTKWEFNNNLSANLAIFETEKTNARSYDADGTVDVSGKTRVRGVEISTTGKVTPKWDISAGYTYLQPKLVDGGAVNTGTTASPNWVNGLYNGNQLKFIAKHSANLWTTYQILDKMSMGGGVTYVGKRFVDDSNTYYLPAHTRFDLFANYQMTPKVGLQLNVNNLTNERIYDASHVGIFSTVAPGRSYSLKGTFKF